MTPAASSNRLAKETSPYLRQHARNPVDWYSWGPEALARARELDRPIFLSIGYSACHWCHVMERESFEDPEVAQLLNEHFVSIKVDREERPDLDQIYMTAVQLLTGQGGWPMSMFLTPDLQPFYGGTYFPPDDRYGRPSFKRVLTSLIEAWKTRREELRQSASQLTEHLKQVSQAPPATGDLDASLLSQAANSLRRAFDPRHGGFGSAPKFPHAMDLQLLLRVWKRFEDDDALQMVRLTLDHMAMGGIYDHLGGGFHRYSTDERWLVPHFEKMLYDNALLTLAYLEGFQATGATLYRRVVQETLDYVLREMTSPEGGFYSTQDADSEGIEGKFFVWSAEEIEQVLGQDRAQVFTYVYDVTPEGNWEGHNILHRAKTDAQDARLLQMDEITMRNLIEECRAALFAVRERRVKPGRDDKVLTSWNGLMIQALARAGAVLERADYTAAAARAADFLVQRMRSPDGRLYRTYHKESGPRLNGYLDDYSFLLEGLVGLFEATFEPRWLELSRQLAEVLVTEFWDASEGGFFYTGRSHETLIARNKDTHDSSTPSGNGMAATALLRLAVLTGKADYRAKALATLRSCQGLLTAAPMAAAQLFLALDFDLGPVQEFAIIGEPHADETRRVLRAIHSSFRPNKVVAVGQGQSSLPLLAGKTSRQGVTTYICQNYACQEPLVGAAAVEAKLAERSSE